MHVVWLEIAGFIVVHMTKICKIHEMYGFNNNYKTIMLLELIYTLIITAPRLISDKL